MGRPPGVAGRAQLKPEELLRVQVLYNDARMGPTEIARITGYTINQIKYAIKKKTPTVGKRTGRPPKNAPPKVKTVSGEGSTETAPEEMEVEDSQPETSQVEEPARFVSQKREELVDLLALTLSRFSGHKAVRRLRRESSS